VGSSDSVSGDWNGILEWNGFFFFVSVLLPATDRSRDVQRCSFLLFVDSCAPVPIFFPRLPGIFFGLGLVGFSPPSQSLGLGNPPLCRVDSKLFTFFIQLDRRVAALPHILHTAYNQFEHWHSRWKSDSSADFWRTVRISFQHFILLLIHHLLIIIITIIILGTIHYTTTLKFIFLFSSYFIRVSSLILCLSSSLYFTTF